MNPLLPDQPAVLHSAIDHLVVVARDLEQGIAWCADTFGVVPDPGGRHPLMATHNRLMKIGHAAWPQAYLEIIAIDPSAHSGPADGRRRWFGIDDPALQQDVAVSPRLVHFVASTSDLRLARTRLALLGEDVGEAVEASRKTSDGELRWQISVRDDGVPQHGGALPTLISWQGSHPSTSLSDSGVHLRSLLAASSRPRALQQAWSAIGLDAVELLEDATEPSLVAVFDSPRGAVTLTGGPPRQSG